MRVRRKPLLMNAWHNSTGKRPDGGPSEPMPPWVKSIAEKDAKPGTTFLITMTQYRPLCPAECVIVQDQLGKVYPIEFETFKNEYESINIAAPAAAQIEGEKK